MDDQLEDSGLELNPAQQQALLEQAMQCLGQMVELEQGLKQSPGSDPRALELVHEQRLQLGEQIQRSRAALRQQRHAAARAGAELATGPLDPGTVDQERHALGPFTRTLGQLPGADRSGPEVIALQALLRLEGLAAATSGRYDAGTALAVKKLQQRHGLKQQDGNVGGETRQLLNRLTGHLR